jgi:chromosomal replication initiator protein
MSAQLNLEDLKAAVASLIAQLDMIEPFERPATAPAISIDLPYVRVPDIVRAVAFETGLKAADIYGPRRFLPLFRARAAVCWLARRLTRQSLARIAAVLGGRHHTSIMNAIAQAEALRAGDPAFRRMTDRLVIQFSQPKEQ